MDKNDSNVPPGLSTIPGWHALDKTEQKWLKEHTRRAVAYQQQSELKKLQCIAEIYKVRQFLHGKQMEFID